MNSNNQVIMTLRYEPSLIQFRKWSNSLRTALVTLSGTRQLRGDNAQQALIFTRSSDATHIRRCFKFIDQIQVRSPSAVKPLLEVTESTLMYPIQYAQAIQHTNLVHAHKQAKESESSRLQSILATSAVLSVTAAAAPPPPPITPIAPPPDIAALAAATAAAANAATANPTDVDLTRAAATAARALADAITTHNPGAVPAPPVNTPHTQLQNLLQQLTTPTSATLTPLPIEEEFFETMIELLTPELCVPCPSEFALIRNLTMGQRNGLNPEVSEGEGPRAFGDRVIQTFRLLQMDSAASIASGYQCNLRQIFYDGVHPSLRSTAITEGHRFHPSRTTPEECIRGVSELLDAQWSHIQMEKMNRYDAESHQRQKDQGRSKALLTHTTGAQPRSPPPSKSDRRSTNTEKGKSTTGMYCAHHQVDTHNTADCNALRRSTGKFCDYHQTSSHSNAECTAQRAGTSQTNVRSETPMANARRVTWEDQQPQRQQNRPPVRPGNNYPPPPPLNRPSNSEGQTLRTNLGPRTPGNQPYRRPNDSRPTAMVTSINHTGETESTPCLTQSEERSPIGYTLSDVIDSSPHLSMYAALVTNSQPPTACLSLTNQRYPATFGQGMNTALKPPKPPKPSPPPTPTPVATNTPITIAPPNLDPPRLIDEDLEFASVWPEPFCPTDPAAVQAVQALASRVITPSDIAGVQRYMADSLGRGHLTYLVNDSSQPDKCLAVGYNGAYHFPVNGLLDSAANTHLISTQAAKAWDIPVLPYTCVINTSTESTSAITGITPPLLLRYGSGKEAVRATHCALVVSNSLFDFLICWSEFKSFNGQMTAAADGVNGTFALRSPTSSVPVTLPTTNRAQHSLPAPPPSPTPSASPLSTPSPLTAPVRSHIMAVVTYVPPPLRCPHAGDNMNNPTSANNDGTVSPTTWRRSTYRPAGTSPQQWVQSWSGYRPVDTRSQYLAARKPGELKNTCHRYVTQHRPGRWTRMTGVPTTQFDSGHLVSHAGALQPPRRRHKHAVVPARAGHQHPDNPPPPYTVATGPPPDHHAKSSKQKGHGRSKGRGYQKGLAHHTVPSSAPASRMADQWYLHHTGDGHLIRSFKAAPDQEVKRGRAPATSPSPEAKRASPADGTGLSAGMVSDSEAESYRAYCDTYRADSRNVLSDGGRPARMPHYIFHALPHHCKRALIQGTYRYEMLLAFDQSDYAGFSYRSGFFSDFVEDAIVGQSATIKRVQEVVEEARSEADHYELVTANCSQRSTDPDSSAERVTPRAQQENGKRFDQWRQAVRVKWAALRHLEEILQHPRSVYDILIDAREGRKLRLKPSLNKVTTIQDWGGHAQQIPFTLKPSSHQPSYNSHMTHNPWQVVDAPQAQQPQPHSHQPIKTEEAQDMVSPCACSEITSQVLLHESREISQVIHTKSIFTLQPQEVDKLPSRKSPPPNIIIPDGVTGAPIYSPITPVAPISTGAIASAPAVPLSQQATSMEISVATHGGREGASPTARGHIAPISFFDTDLQLSPTEICNLSLRLTGARLESQQLWTRLALMNTVSLEDLVPPIDYIDCIHKLNALYAYYRAAVTRHERLNRDDCWQVLYKAARTMVRILFKLCSQRYASQLLESFTTRGFGDCLLPFRLKSHGQEPASDATVTDRLHFFMLASGVMDQRALMTMPGGRFSPGTPTMSYKSEEEAHAGRLYPTPVHLSHLTHITQSHQSHLSHIPPLTHGSPHPAVTPFERYAVGPSFPAGALTVIKGWGPVSPEPPSKGRVGKYPDNYHYGGDITTLCDLAAYPVHKQRAAISRAKMYTFHAPQAAVAVAAVTKAEPPEFAPNSMAPPGFPSIFPTMPSPSASALRSPTHPTSNLTPPKPIDPTTQSYRREMNNWRAAVSTKEWKPSFTPPNLTLPEDAPAPAGPGPVAASTFTFTPRDPSDDVNYKMERAKKLDMDSRYRTLRRERHLLRYRSRSRSISPASRRLHRWFTRVHGSHKTACKADILAHIRSHSWCSLCSDNEEFDMEEPSDAVQDMVRRVFIPHNSTPSHLTTVGKEEHKPTQPNALDDTQAVIGRAIIGQHPSLPMGDDSLEMQQAMFQSFATHSGAPSAAGPSTKHMGGYDGSEPFDSLDLSPSESSESFITSESSSIVSQYEVNGEITASHEATRMLGVSGLMNSVRRTDDSGRPVDPDILVSGQHIQPNFTQRPHLATQPNPNLQSHPLLTPQSLVERDNSYESGVRRVTSSINNPIFEGNENQVSGSPHSFSTQSIPSNTATPDHHPTTPRQVLADITNVGDTNLVAAATCVRSFPSLLRSPLRFPLRSSLKDRLPVLRDAWLA